MHPLDISSSGQVLVAVGKSVEWKRERLVASGARFLGYEYQHHHIFDWDPPAGWPWNSCCTGHQGKAQTRSRKHQGAGVEARARGALAVARRRRVSEANERGA